VRKSVTAMLHGLTSVIALLRNPLHLI